MRYTESQTVATQRGITMDDRFGLPRHWHGRLLAGGKAQLGKLAGLR